MMSAKRAASVLKGYQENLKIMSGNTSNAMKNSESQTGLGQGQNKSMNRQTPSAVGNQDSQN